MGKIYKKNICQSLASTSLWPSLTTRSWWWVATGDTSFEIMEMSVSSLWSVFQGVVGLVRVQWSTWAPHYSTQYHSWLLRGRRLHLHPMARNAAKQLRPQRSQIYLLHVREEVPLVFPVKKRLKRRSNSPYQKSHVKPEQKRHFFATNLGHM